MGARPAARVLGLPDVPAPQRGGGEDLRVVPGRPLEVVPPSHDRRVGPNSEPSLSPRRRRPQGRRRSDSRGRACLGEGVQHKLADSGNPAQGGGGRQPDICCAHVSPMSRLKTLAPAGRSRLRTTFDPITPERDERGTWVQETRATLPTGPSLRAVRGFNRATFARPALLRALSGRAASGSGARADAVPPSRAQGSRRRVLAKRPEPQGATRTLGARPAPVRERPGGVSWVRWAG